MTDHQEALRNYLREVAHQLVLRGIVRIQFKKENFMTILRQAPSEVIGMVVRDLQNAGISVGKELLASAARSALGALLDPARRR